MHIHKRERLKMQLLRIYVLVLELLEKVIQWRDRRSFIVLVSMKITFVEDSDALADGDQYMCA